MSNRRDEYDWIELVAKAGKLIGLNEVRTRWRLRAWQDRMKNRSRRVEQRAGQVTRKVRTCPHCKAINSMDEKVCSQCGAKLRLRQIEVVDRFFRQFGVGLTPETFIALGCIAVFAASLIQGRSPDEEGVSFWRLMMVPSYTLAQMGANVMDPLGRYRDLAAHLTVNGQWWRLLTSVFLHVGLWHLAFNMYALVYLAPQAREVYGRSKMIFAFVFTGIFASAVSLGWRMYENSAAVSAGASGAICGLIGLMMVWGQRDGTTSGIMVRNLMARWTIYTLLFGYFIGADNAAHMGGLISGAILALVFKEQFHRQSSTAWVGIGVASSATIAGAVIYIIFRAFTG